MSYESPPPYSAMPPSHAQQYDSKPPGQGGTVHVQPMSYIPPHAYGGSGMPPPPGFMPAPGFPDIEPASPHPGYYSPHIGPYSSFPPGINPESPRHGAPAPRTTQPVLQHQSSVQTMSEPIELVCPHCQRPVVTHVNYIPGTLSVVMCVLCCIFGCDLGCCFIPCILDSFKDAEHSCPNCKANLFVYKRL
uniref:Cell death-inducing p53 target 1 n=1 Tax=Eptatretus burgeri TaxID=7764 RepID=A0A8C4X1H0_EPTBU